MISFSRRQLAHYAVEEILAKQHPAVLAKRLAAALIASGRGKEVEMLLSDIDQELEDRGLVAQARVISARQLSDDLQRELAAKIKELADVKEVVATHKVDKDVLGGFRVETANHAWDKTSRRMLMRLKEDK